MSTSHYKGIAYALGACLIWGLIFIVPQFMKGFTPLEIAIGRYFTYGSISALILMKMYLQGRCRFPAKIWLKAILFSVTCSFGYYTFVVLSVRYSTPAICALIIGITPIAIAFYGNWKKKECSYQSLIMPSVLILVGLVIINVPNLIRTAAPSTYLIGLFCAVWALLGWSWYAVANSNFLKSNREVNSSDWSTVIGVSTLFWVVVFSVSAAIFFEDEFDFSKYFTLGPELTNFLLGCATLGILCSWVGGFLWNKACLHLPVSFAGQLTIFETVFGLCYIYALEGSLPPVLECLGMAFLLMAIAYGIRATTRVAPEVASAT